MSVFRNNRRGACLSVSLQVYGLALFAVVYITFRPCGGSLIPCMQEKTSEEAGKPSEPHPFEQFIRETGCWAFNKDCLKCKYDKDDWEKCQRQVRSCLCSFLTGPADFLPRVSFFLFYNHGADENDKEEKLGEVVWLCPLFFMILEVCFEKSFLLTSV